MRSVFRTLAGLTAVAAALALTACDSVSNMLSPGQPAELAPARLALNATIPRFQGSGFAQVQLRVLAEYQRVESGFQSLDTQLFPLSDAATQQVPISLELSACLADPQRRDAAADPGACFVRLTLSLIGDGRVLDDVVLSVMRLAPGVTSTVAQPVLLSELQSVQIIAAGQVPLPPSGLSLTEGGSFALAAVVKDGSGSVVTGRTVTWSSNNTAVATVSATGVVTAVAAGSTSVVVSTGGVSAQLPVTVIPPSRRLSVVGAASNGNGRIVSTPSGIDCIVTAGATSGTCAFDFANGTSVELEVVDPPLFTSRFNGWSGACLSNGTSPNCTLVMDTPRSTGVSFTGLTLVQLRAARFFTGITVSSPTESAVSGQRINCAYDNPLMGTCVLPFFTGESVTFTATETAIARAIGWTGCDSSTRTTCTVALANSTARALTLDATPGNVVSIQTVGTGTGVVQPTSFFTPGFPNAINCGPTVPTSSRICSTGYPAGSTLQMRGVADPGSRFVGWGSSPCEADGSTCLISSTTGDGSSIVLVAEFVPDVVAVSLQLSGSGRGTVLVDGSPACVLSSNETSRQCSLDVQPGTELRFTGAPESSGQFLGFGGACSGMDCTRTIVAASTITATFTSTPPVAVITVEPIAGHARSGFIYTSLEDIDCEISGSSTSGPCTTTRPAGSVVTLHASDFASESGVSVFRRWGGASPCPNSPEIDCTFVATSGETTISVEFVEGATLDIELGDEFSDNGSLTISVPGYRQIEPCVFNGGASATFCLIHVPRFTNVTLRAIPSGSGFANVSSAQFCSWSEGGVCTFFFESQRESGFIYFVNPGLLEQVAVAPTARTFTQWQRETWSPAARRESGSALGRAALE